MFNRGRSGVLLLAALALAGCEPEASFDTVAEQTSRTFDFASSLTTAAPITPLQPLDVEWTRVRLGKRLFHDPRLSRDGKIACATCHVIAEGGDDGLRKAVGIDAAVGRLNTPTVLNASLNFAQFWDGRATTLEEQVPGPIHDPKEMGSSLESAVARLAGDAEIVARFADLYADGLTGDNMVDAIAAYERALTTPGSPFDRYLEGEDEALEPRAKRGYDLFLDLGCVSCHQGRNVGGNMFQHFGVMGDYFADRGNVTEADYGRYNVTGREEDKFMFKVPSLRNVAETAPYFHDGSAERLADAVRTMIRYQLGRPIKEEQVADIIAFLESLTGEVHPELL